MFSEVAPCRSLAAVIVLLLRRCALGLEQQTSPFSFKEVGGELPAFCNLLTDKHDIAFLGEKEIRN